MAEQITAAEIIRAIETEFPKSLAMDWDNPGLELGRGEHRTEKVMLALDASRRVVKEAVERGADLLITHHPMIFGSIRQINDETALGRKLLDLAEHKIAYYAMHTNYDAALHGMTMAAARRLGWERLSPLEVTGEQEGEPVGIGFVAELPEPMEPSALAKHCKETFELASVWYYDGGHSVRKVAVCPGSGRHMMEAVRACGADAFITGDTGHHDGLDYFDEELTLVDAGHFGIEHIFTEEMEAFLTSRFPGLIVMKEETDERRYV